MPAKAHLLACIPALAGSKSVCLWVHQVYEQMLAAGRAVAAPLLPGILERATSAFEAGRHAACLRVLGAGVAEFCGEGGGGDAPETAALIGAAFRRACAAAAPLLQARHTYQ